MPLLTRLVAAAGGVALSLIAATGVASALPDIDPIINSTCTYPQVIAALNATDPDLAGRFAASPLANAWLQSLINAPADQRRSMVEQAQTFRGVPEATPTIVTVAQTCNNY
jgi:hemophore-related protein